MVYKNDSDIGQATSFEPPTCFLDIKEHLTPQGIEGYIHFVFFTFLKVSNALDQNQPNDVVPILAHIVQ